MRLFLICVLIIIPGVIFAQMTWERLPGPDGTWNIQCIAIDGSSGDLFVGTASGGGIYKSTDQGATWVSKSSGLPVNQAVTDITVSGSSVIAVAGNIFRSTDGGDSWAEVEGGPGGITNLHVTSGGEMFAGSELSAGGQGIFKSDDNGATWTLSAAGIPSYVIFLTYYRSVSAVTSDGSGNLYCSVNSGDGATEAGVYKSTDDGASWTRTSEGLPGDYRVRPVSVSPGGRIYVGVKHRVHTSTDNGTTWTIADSLPIATSSWINAFAYNASGEVFVATTAGLYRGTEAGTEWTQLGASSLPGNVADVAIHSGTSIAGGLDIWGYQGGCFRSTDNGDSWEASNAGMNNAFVNTLHVAPSGHIYSGLGRGRLEYSTDGGETFTRVVLPYTVGSLAAIAAIAGNESGALVATTFEGMYASADGGATWTRTSGTAAKTFGTDPSNNFYAATSGGVFKSADGGQTWTSMGGGGNSNTVFYTAAGTILSGTYNNGIERSTDDGANWTNSGTSLFGNITIGFFIQVPDGTIYTHTLGGIFRSTDDGASWAAVTGTPIGEQYRTIASAGGTILLGTTLGGVYYSSDGAGTWQQSTEGFLSVTVTWISVAPDGHAYVSGGAGIYRTQAPVATGIEMLSSAVPAAFDLRQNYPNPFNPVTTIEFTLPKSGFVELKVFDILGKNGSTLISGNLNAGNHTYTFNANNLASGVYYYQLIAGEFREVKKMILLR